MRGGSREQAKYDEYLKRFNGRDYERGLEYWADDLEVVFAGYRMRGRDEMLQFYGSFRQYVKKSVHYSRLALAHACATFNHSPSREK